MIIYIDIIFFENICMNYIILLATGLILKKKISYLRILGASALGGIYAIVMYVTSFYILYGIAMKIFLSIAMVYIAFGTTKLKMQIKELLVFYLSSFAFGGTAFALIYFIKPQNVLMKNGVYVGTYAFNIVIIGGVLGFILINIVFKLVMRKISKEDMNCELIIEFKQKSINIKTMIDTGNLLKDPITKSPVVIVEKDSIKELIPEEILDNIEKILGGDAISVSKNYEEYMSIFKVVPFKSIGREHRINIGI